MNTFGHLFRLTSFGESHGPGVGGVIDGFPAGVKIDFDFLQQELNRRRPGQSLLTTPRKELDKEKEVARKQVQKQVRKQSLDNTALYLAKTSQDLNFTKEYALQHLTEVTGATRQEALKYLNKYWRS